MSIMVDCYSRPVLMQKVTGSTLGYASQEVKKCLYPPSGKWVPFLESERDKAAKGKELASPFIGVGRFRILGGPRFRILGGPRGGQIPSRHMTS